MSKIRRYSIGTFMDTGAVISKLPKETGEIPYLKRIQRMELKKSDKEPQEEMVQRDEMVYHLSFQDRIYGLGENVRGINKRGWLYESNCTDDPNHTESKHSLYGAHNFFVVDGRETFGVFLDYPGKLILDMGYGQMDEIRIVPQDWNLDVYILEGGSILEIVKSFRKLIGRSYIPPKWAFGYGQSRWGYQSAAEIREVVKGYRENGIPLDAVYLDIDYMEGFKDFTIDKERFPDFPKFAEEMRKEHIHLVPIIDAGVKIEEGYEVYEEGKKNGYFCKDQEGKEFVGAVWPGKVHFPDVLNKEARKWFGQKYQGLLEQGIEGFWNDMNEPAIFYSEKNLEQVLKKIKSMKSRNMDMWEVFAFRDIVNGLANNPKDYSSFYHEIEGKKICHDKVHNLYGFGMTRAAGEAFEELEPEKRILLFSRASYIGMHRYGGVWMGDNQSWWSHLLLNLKMLPSLNMCGFLYTGADLGGFGSDVTEDLLLRWLALGIFTPLMRNHSALGTREQECYRFTQTEVFRNLIGIRYGLMPYLYSEYMKAALKDEMLFMPLAFVYPEDAHAREVEDQLLVGESIMIAPVYTQNAGGRYVYLPEPMKLVRLKDMEHIETEVLEQGHYYIEISLEEVVFFIRPGKIVPYTKAEQYVKEIPAEELRLMHFEAEGLEYELYQDDGFEKDYENPEHFKRLGVK
ncbi:MAG: alpha-glucosidase [Lachnospiraceae bacterium]|nr:alpha-glucosidase [Lachnospiraceae bacterium]